MAVENLLVSENSPFILDGDCQDRLQPLTSMKTLTTIAISLVSLIITCTAGVTDELVGTWEGTLTASVNGQTAKARAKFVFEKYQGTGLKSKSTVTLPENPKAVAVRSYRGNRKVIGTVKQGTYAFNESGTWTSTNRSLTAKTNVSAGGMVLTQIMSLRLLKNGKLRLTETTSTGFSESKVVGTLSRK
jgi:hypothetical protein